MDATRTPPDATRMPCSDDLETKGSESDWSTCDTIPLDATHTPPDATRVKTQTERLTPELKPLHLRYEFLNPDRCRPVIISADLEPDRTATLLEKL